MSEVEFEEDRNPLITFAAIIIGFGVGAGAGGAAGVAIGSAIFPGPGTFIGALIGVGAGGLFGASKGIATPKKTLVRTPFEVAKFVAGQSTPNK